MRRLRVCCTIMFLLLAGGAEPAIARQPEIPGAVVVDRAAGGIKVENGVEYLLETAPLDFAAAADLRRASGWRTFSGRTVNLGYRLEGVWLRFDVVNPSSQDLTRWLEIGWPILDHVELGVYRHQARIWADRSEMGEMLPPAENTGRHRNCLFPVSLPAGERVTVYLRVQSADTLILPLMLWEREVLLLQERHETFFLGLFFGILAVMLLYNGSLYVFTRDRNYVFYCFYLLTIIFYELALTGVGGLYLWPQPFWLKSYLFALFVVLSFLAATVFVRYFLSLASYGGWLLHLNTVIGVSWISAAAAVFLVPSPVVGPGLELLAMVTCIAALVTTIYLWTKGNVSAKYFTIAWTILIFGTMAQVLSMNGILDRNFFTEYSQQVGFMAEVVLLSFALAERINRERMERVAAQQMALEMSEKVNREREAKLKAQSHLLEIQRMTNETLEIRVLERTAELERVLNNLEMANQELANLNMTDPLTKLYNRRYFDQIIATEIKRANRIQKPLAVVLADIDHFKQVNDTYGHLVGDECLRLVAATLKQCTGRVSDMVARYGGEEFAMILPATREAEARQIADKARQAVADIIYIHRRQQISLSISLGVAAWIPDQQESPERLLRAADAALYQAKRAGRNRVVLSGAVQSA